MASSGIADSIAGVVEYLTANPDAARGTDTLATATVDGLRATVVGPNGASLVCDMPQAIGGSGSAPTPGWAMRAALAGCDAIVIAMRAAMLGVVLDTLEVTVESDSDDRGLLGVDDEITAGPLGVRVGVRIGAVGVTADDLHAIVEWAEHHSPVGTAIRTSVPTVLEVEIA